MIQKSATMLDLAKRNVEIFGFESVSQSWLGESELALMCARVEDVESEKCNLN